MKRIELSVAKNKKYVDDSVKVAEEVNLYSSDQQPHMIAERFQIDDKEVAPSKAIKAGSMFGILKKALTGRKEVVKELINPKVRNGKYVNQFHLGETKSKKPIMSHFEHESHKDFGPNEHRDAYFAHKQRIEEMHPSAVTADIRTHHEDQARKHWGARMAQLDTRDGIKQANPEQHKKIAGSLKRAMNKPDAAPEAPKDPLAKSESSGFYVHLQSPKKVGEVFHVKNKDGQHQQVKVKQVETPNSGQTRHYVVPHNSPMKKTEGSVPPAGQSAGFFIHLPESEKKNKGDIIDTKHPKTGQSQKVKVGYSYLRSNEGKVKHWVVPHDEMAKSDDDLPNQDAPNGKLPKPAGNPTAQPNADVTAYKKS